MMCREKVLWMPEVKPFIHCVDYWPGQIPPAKRKAYRELIDEGQILKHNVIVNQATGTTAVEYYAIAPHDWIRDELAKRAGVI